MSKAEDYQTVSEEARLKRSAFVASAAAAKARIAPARLRADLYENMAQSLSDTSAKAKATMRERPFATAAAATALIAFFARRPIGALFQRLYVRVKDRRNARKSETDNG